MIDSIFHTMKADILPKVRNVGKSIVTKREESEFHITTKPDGSLVTNVDHWANDQLTEIICSYFPTHTIIGEETSEKPTPHSEVPTWYLDPIDGTKQYVMGKDHFYILIGCSFHGEADVGFYYKPFEDHWILSAPKLNLLETNKPHLLTNSSCSWSNANPITLKHLSSEQKDEILQFDNISKASYLYHTVDLLGPLFGLTNGYLCFRRAHFWDICAPLAIMQTIGFNVQMFDQDGNVTNFKDTALQARSFYSLPPNVPNELILWFEKNKPTLVSDD